MPGNNEYLSDEEFLALAKPSAPPVKVNSEYLSDEEFLALGNNDDNLDAAIAAQAEHAKRTRGIGETINDTVIETANSAAGMVGAIGDFIVPGNRVSEGIDSFIKEGEKHQSDVVRADKEKFQIALKKSETIGDDLSAVADYIMSSPLQATAQAIGSFGPTGLGMKAAKVGTGILGGSEKAATIASRTTGIGMGVAGGGGDAAGDAYKLVQSTPDEVLMKHPVVIDLVAKGVPFDQIKDDIATRAARKASIFPGIAGGVAGYFGAEKLLAGGAIKDGYKHIVGTGLVDGGTEAIEEGIAKYTGQSAAQQYNPAINPWKNVAASTAMGGVLGFGTGASIAAITPTIPDAKNVDELISATKSSIDVELDNQTNQDLLDEISASNNATSSNAPVDQSYVPQPDTKPRPTINIAPDVQPLVDNAEPLVSGQAQPIIEQSQPTDLNVNPAQAGQEPQPTEGATNGTTSKPADPILDSGSAASTSANPAGSDGNGVLRYDTTTGTGGLGLPGAVVETDGASGVSANGSNQQSSVDQQAVDRVQPTVNSDLTTTPASTLPSKPTTSSGIPTSAPPQQTGTPILAAGAESEALSVGKIPVTPQQSPSTHLPVSAPQEDVQAGRPVTLPTENIEAQALNDRAVTVKNAIKGSYDILINQKSSVKSTVGFKKMLSAVEGVMETGNGNTKQFKLYASGYKKTNPEVSSALQSIAKALEPAPTPKPLSFPIGMRFDASILGLDEQNYKSQNELSVAIAETEQNLTAQGKTALEALLLEDQFDEIFGEKLTDTEIESWLSLLDNNEENDNSTTQGTTESGVTESAQGSEQDRDAEAQGGEAEIKPYPDSIPKTIKQLEVENKSTAPKIPTPNVFKNEVGTLSRAEREGIDDAIENKKESDLPTETIDIGDIVPTQKNLTIKNLQETSSIENLRDGKDAVILVKKDGKYFVVDGHHRIANAILKGKRSVEAKVFNNAAKPQPESKPERTGKIGDGAKKSPLEKYLSESPEDKGKLNVVVTLKNKDGNEVRGALSDHIDDAFKNGYRVVLTKSGPAFVNDKMRGYSEREISPAGMRYANWLDSNENNDGNETEFATKKPTDPISQMAASVESLAKSVQTLVDNQGKAVQARAIDMHADLFERIKEGEVSADEFKASFDALLKNKDGITAELEAMTKPEIFKRFPDIEYRYKNEKKNKGIEAAYRDMIEGFTLGQSYSYGMSSGSMIDSIRALVEKTTDESLADYADKIKKSREERAAKREEAKAVTENPQTLDDFNRLMQVKAQELGEGTTFAQARMTLTPEQREKFDELAAAKTRSERETRKTAQQEQSMRAPGEVLETTEIIKTKHTKHGHDLWQLNLVQRVSSDEFKVLAGQAKRLGGDYSSYRGNGAIPGWQFRTEEAAKAFKALVAGDTAQAKDIAQTRRDAYADDRSQSATERLNEMADKLDEQADESLGQNRKENTNRRAEQAARAETAARSDKALAQTMRNIASAIEDGSAKFLDQIRQKIQVETLRGFVNTGSNEMLRKRYPEYGDYLKHKDEPVTKEVADYITYPSYTVFRSDLSNIGRSLLEVDGTKKLGQQIMKVADDVSATYLKFAKDNIDKVATFRTKNGERAAFASKDNAEEAIARSNYHGAAIVLPVKRGENLIILSPSEAIKRGIWQGDNDKRITLHPDIGAELVEKMGRAARRGVKISVPWQLENAYDSRKRLAGMNIETPAELRAAVREFIELREAPKEDDKVKQLERAMIGRSNDGLDFFPTPEGVADAMVQSADIREGMSVLEPSAGMGHIADRIREAGVEPDVVELSASRRELLEAKGYSIVDHDFMDVESKYDRIIMNPPFGDRRDAMHVQHAYKLLKPNGRLVAIVGEGVFFGNDAKAQEFRNWLEKVGGTDEKLDQGTFLDPSLPVNTGVSARMVVIDKSTDPLFSKSSPVENTHTVASATSAMLEAHTGKIKSVLQAMLDSGKAKVVTAEQAAELVGENSLHGDNAQAFYNPNDGITYFIAENIPGNYTVKEWEGLVLHEIATHALNLGRDTKEFKSILSQIELMRKAGNKAVIAAFKRVPKDTAPENVTEEALAYMLQESPQLGIVQRVLAWFRSAIRAIGKSFPTLQKMKLHDWASNLNESDLRFMAESALKNSERSGVQNESGTPQFSKKVDTITVDGVERSRLNSNGKPIANSDEALRNFWEWFGDSEIVDKESRPLVVYHASNKPDISVFDVALTRDIGIHFSESDLSNKFGGSVYPSYLKIKNSAAIQDIFSVDGSGYGIYSRMVPGSINVALDLYSEDSEKLFDLGHKVEKAWSDDREVVNVNSKPYKNFWKKVLSLSKQEGIDGFEYKNKYEGGGKSFVVFDANQVKSATGNNGNFSKSDNNILFSKNTNPITHPFQPENSGKPLDSWIKIFTRNQIVTLYRDSLIGKKLEEYKELRELVTADTNKLFEKADNFLLELRQIPKGLRDAFASLAHDSTLNNVDPSNPKYVPSPDAVKLADYLANNPTNQTLAAKIKKRLNNMEAAHKKLHAEFNALPAKEQELFKELRSKYTEQMTMVFDEFKNRIGRMKNIDPAIKASSVKKLDEQLTDLLGRVYFPLYRAGNYIVKAEKAGEPTTVDHVESNFAADRLEKKLKKLGYTVSRSTRIVSPQDNKSGEALNAVRDLLDKAALKGKIEGAELSQLMDDIDQTILQSLPDQSYRKSFIHRKGTKGYSDDFIRAYADAMRRGSINIANLRHGDKIATVIEDMRKDVKDASKVPGSNVQALNQVLDRVEQIEVDIRNPTSKLVSVSGKIAFAQMLGSLSNFILNITQTPLLTMPHLGAEYGYGKANLQLSMAYAKQMRSLKKQGTLSELGKWLDMRHGLVGNELDLMQQLHDSGALDLTQSFDLIDAANNPSYQENELSMNFMKVIALPQHVSEIVNRQVTALAAIRLEMARSGSPLKAYHAARKAIDETHFNYSKENRAKLMTGNTQSILFRFKQYAQQAAFLFVHTAKLALDGSTKLDSDGNKLDGTRPSERTKARKQLAGVLGMQILAAGMLGLPIFTEAAVAASGVAGFKLAGSTGAYVGVAGAIILAAALAFGDDDGEEFDVEVKKWFIKHFGYNIGSSLADGVIPRGLASRLNASELVIRRPEEARNSTDFANQWMISLLGAFLGGTVYNAGVGLKDIIEGDTAKGATKLIPVKAIKDLVTSWKWANDGMNVTNKDGEIITPVSKADIFFKSIGINPTSVVNAREYENAKHTLHNALLKKQQKALKELREETDKTKRFNAIIKYNKSAPLGYEIDSDKVRGVIAREIKYKGKPNVVTGNPVQEDYLNKNTRELRPAY